jgi:hypothetical protein
MSVTKAYTLYAADIDGSLIDQISSFGINSGLEQFIQYADGAVDPTYTAVKSLVPRLTFSTNAIASAMAIASMDGAAISSAANFFLQQIKQGGTRWTGSKHIKLAVTSGMVFPRSINAGHDAPAEMQYEVLALTDSSNDAVVITADQALTGTPAADELFVAGPVYINGSQVPGVQSINIDFGINEILLGGDGDLNPSFSAIGTRTPKITIETFHADVLATYGLDGVAQGATDSKIYLRKVQQGGSRVADGTAEHILFTVAAGHIGIGDSSMNSGDPQTVSLEITPSYDGTNDILAFSSASAIS